jgi:hypothetical protein
VEVFEWLIACFDVIVRPNQEYKRAGALSSENNIVWH